MELTAELNEKSIEYIKKQVEYKNSAWPYFSNGLSISNSVTDMDHHPYSRYFRGVYYYPDPIIFEREAGWRPNRSYCYDLVMPPPHIKQPHICFEPACTTSFPCFPGKNGQELDEAINHNCIVQYR